MKRVLMMCVDRVYYRREVLTCPLTLTISLRIRWVSTMRVLYRTPLSLSLNRAYLKASKANMQVKRVVLERAERVGEYREEGGSRQSRTGEVSIEG